MNDKQTNLLSRMIYPVLMGATMTGHLVMMTGEFGVLLSTYVPLIVVATCISLLETLVPERRDWTPGLKTVMNDTIFMVIVQMVVPKLLGYLALLMAARLAQSQGVTASLWPHHWPVLVQALLMLIAADFIRYWMHRAFHHYPALWKLHSVHHAPCLLYWLNVGRFHPMEKAIQFCVDTMPFILLGVAEPVLGLYFVFYAANGFLQHSNLRLIHGWLNFVISTAELHRWHHARDKATAYCNFGNNLIVWDMLFGSRYLPPEQQVDQLGVEEREWNDGFFRECMNPFAAQGLQRPSL